MNDRIKTVFHKLRIDDVEDPYLWAAHPILEWQKTEKGQWCMSRAGIDPTFTCQQAPDQWGYTVIIHGDLSPSDYSYFQLRWGFDDKAN